MTTFKVGDKVTLNPESCWTEDDEYNPLNIEGVITNINNVSLLSLTVKWSNGADNSYQECDLTNVEEAPTSINLSKKKIWVADLTEDQKKRIQDVAFEQGLCWHSSQYTYNYLEMGAYFFGSHDDSFITGVDTTARWYFDVLSNNEEITYADLFPEEAITEPAPAQSEETSVDDLRELCVATDCSLTLTSDTKISIWSNTYESQVDVDSIEAAEALLIELQTISERIKALGL
jgi:hypothetical protein